MNLRLGNILPECYVDTNVVQTLLRQKGANHQKSCNLVLGTIHGKFNDKLAIGIIDDDKRHDSPYFNDYSEEIASNDELTIRKDPSQHHYLILINNVMENFLLSCANESHYDLTKNMGIPQTKEGLMSITKKKDSQEDPVVTNLVKKLSKSSNMVKLKKSIRYIMEHPFDNNTEGIRSIFKE